MNEGVCSVDVRKVQLVILAVSVDAWRRANAQSAESLINSQSILPADCRANQGSSVSCSCSGSKSSTSTPLPSGKQIPHDHVAYISAFSPPMPAQPRGRACQNCQSIKIKCELGAHGGEPPCERCIRLNKSCTLAAPKRQKDRVAELEAKVEALTRLLGSQGLQDASDEARSLRDSRSHSPEQSGYETIASSQKKRKLDSPTTTSQYRISASTLPSKFERDESSINDLATDWLDRLVPIDLQRRLLDKYIASYQPTLPVVPLSSGTDAETMRKTMPLTLHTIVYITSAGTLSWDLQDKINLALIEELTSTTIVHCKKSLDILQALQMVCLWYRSPRNSTQIPLFQLVAIASDMAVDLGFGGLQNPPALSIAGVSANLLDSIDAHRRWLTSYIITESTALLKRKVNEQKWTSHHDYCLQKLEKSGLVVAEDCQLAQFVHATRLLACISENLELSVASVSPTLGTPICQKLMDDMQQKIVGWRLQIPFDMWSSSLIFTGYYAEVLLYEIALHTPTNKSNFAAPFIMERLSVVDVATPTLTQHHMETFSALRTACHNLLDTAASFTDLEIITLPTMIYGPRIAHTMVALLKLHICVTIQGNTYGQILQAENLQTEAYLDKCLAMVARGSKIEPEAVMVRIAKYMQNLKEWLHQYEASRLAHKELVHGHSGFHTDQVDQKQVLQEVHLRTATSLGSSQSGTMLLEPDRVYDADAAFADFINAEFAMDDFGLFELYSESA